MEQKETTFHCMTCGCYSCGNRKHDTTSGCVSWIIKPTKDEEITFVATATITKTYTVERMYYPDGATIEQIIKMEKQGLEDDPGLILDGGNIVVVVNEKVD